MSLAAAWNRFWFVPATATSLGACRIAFFAAVLGFYGDEDFRFVARLAELVWQPVGFAAWLPFGAPAAETIGLMQWLWRISLVAALTGLATRISTAVAAVLGVYLLVLPYCVSRVSHESAVMAIGLGVMAVARCGDALSLDRRLGWSRALPPSGEYAWPVHLMRVVLSLAFFAGGFSKLRNSGLAWVHSGYLQDLIAGRSSPLGAIVAESEVFCRVLAAATIVIETLHPLALFSAVWAWIFVPAGLGLLLGILVLMGIPFWPLVAMHLFWIPWGRLRRPAA